jgi:hypothetical protein
MSLQNIIYIVIGIWLLVLSILTLFVFSFIKRLTKVAKEADIRKLLDRILVGEKINSEDITKLKSEVNRLTDEGMGHIQKVGLVRFNPFKEIGGDHSSTLSILDGRDNGVVITVLHTRDRTRVYSKEIKNGKCEFELSEEEKKALLKAHRN